MFPGTLKSVPEKESWSWNPVIEETLET